MSVEVPIVTFNLSLDPYRINTNNTSHNINYDWLVIQDILCRNINNTTNCILCFQDIDQQIESKLHAFFSKVNYCFITCQYDIKKLGNSIGIAFSHISYNLVETQVIRLGDVVNEIYGLHEEDIVPRQGLWNKIYGYLYDYMDNFRFMDSVWSNTIKNNYKILGIKLKYKNGFFWVWTCNLPEEPNMNVVYAMTMIRIIALKTSRLAFVIAGTFNCHHDSDSYNMICGDDDTKKTISDRLGIEPHPFSNKKFIPSVDTIPMYSSFKVLERKEPITHEQNIKGIGIARDTTDYIFTHYGVKIVKVEKNDIFNNELYSDKHILTHVPIISTFSI